MANLKIDGMLLEATIAGTLQGLEMTGMEPVPVGATRFFSTRQPIAVMVGLVGKASGNVTLNVSERAMLRLAGGLMGEELPDANDDTFDAIMEIGNIVAGGIKEKLHGSDYEVDRISVPSLVLGASYEVHYTRGIEIVSVEFELETIPIVYHRDRFFSSTLSLQTQG
jgi:CheY-specific phosphatase CheX